MKILKVPNFENFEIWIWNFALLPLNISLLDFEIRYFGLHISGVVIVIFQNGIYKSHGIFANRFYTRNRLDFYL